MTFAVEWALNNNYLSISIFLFFFPPPSKQKHDADHKSVKHAAVFNPSDVTAVAVVVVLTTSPGDLRRVTMTRRRMLARPGWAWLALVPLAVFLLCQLLQLREHLRRPTANTTLLPSPRENTLADLHPDLTYFSQLGSSAAERGSAASWDPRLLLSLERRTAEDYLRVQLALAASSGSLSAASLAGPPLLDVGTLRDLRTFQPLLTPREKAHLLLVFRLFSAACRDSGLGFFLLGHSLLGSLRHHGVVPWSAVSVAVAMSAGDQPRVLRALDGREDLALMWPNPYSWSLRLRGFRPDPPDLLRMTYVEIRFYRQNDTHLWGETWGGRRTFTAARERVFPLALRPFEGRLTPVPCDVTSVLGPRDVQQCRAVLEDPEEMGFRDGGAVPCEVLSRVFPFVGRRLAMAPRSTVEQVFVNGTLLYTALVETGCRADGASEALP